MHYFSSSNSLDNLFTEALVSRKYRIYRHSALVIFFVVLLLNQEPLFVEPMLIYSRIVALFLFLLVFYTNMYVLVPKLLFQRRYIFFGFGVLLMAYLSGLVYNGGWTVLRPYLLESKKERTGVNNLLLTFIIIVMVLASAAVKLFQKLVIDARRMSDLENATAQAELKQLKNQINPHFLFNMLNSVNVLMQTDREKASQVIMKLSDLLRYQLYDSGRNKVLLTSEIHFLTDFLNLEKVRRDNFDFIISTDGDINGLLIPPLLFSSFVENAAKHSMDTKNKSYVHLYFNFHSGELDFKCNNSKPKINGTKSLLGGLGLANITRMLELLFPESHNLVINDQEYSYGVQLTMTL